MEISEDKEDPEEDPVDHPADGGDNDNNESSDNDNDDDDVVKDEEDDEEEDQLASADPSAVSTNNPCPLKLWNIEEVKTAESILQQHTISSFFLRPIPVRETMKTVNQGVSVEEIERVVAQRAANAIEAIYEMETNMVRKSMS
ncbi:hypothetical protein Tco_1504424 [Tanacetum coccineum]